MAISSAVAVFDSVNSTTQTSASITYHASATGTNQGANTVGVGLSSTSSGTISAIGTSNPIYTFTTAWGSTSSQKATGTNTVTISGLSASTTYNAYIVVYGIGSGNILAASSARSITTQSPPQPPSQNWGPSISGTAVSGTVLYAYAGSYNNASSVTTKIAYNTSGSFSGSNTTQNSPYTVTDLDASYPPYYYAAVDIVVGTNGGTYYYYSSPIVSKLLVSFNTQGGTSVSSIPYIANTYTPAYIQLPYTSRSGYTFNGWYTASSGGTRVGGDYENYAPPTSNSITLYAQWTLTPVTQNYAPTLYGNAVSGTQLTASAGGYSSYASITTKVAYNTSGIFSGSSATQVSPYTVTDNDASYPPYYYAAVDVVTDNAGADHYYYSSTPVIAKFQITYKFYNGSSDQIDTFVSEISNTPITLPTPAKTGYTFIGWYDDSPGGSYVANGGESYTPPNSNVVLHAHWTANEYTLSYNAGGGSVSPLSKTVTYDSAYGILPTPTWAGHTFSGWFTQPAGGTAVNSSTIYATAADSTIYAQWESILYTVTFDPNGGSVSPDTKTVTSGLPYGELPTPTRPGYTFDGWFTLLSGGDLVNAETTFTSAENITLYAHWTAATPIFTDQEITTTAYLGKDVNTNIDFQITASPVTSYSIIHSGSGLDPSTWLSITKDSIHDHGILSGKPTQIGTYTFVIRAINSGAGYTDSALITMVVYPVGKRKSDSSMIGLTVAKRFNGSSWIDLKIMRRFDEQVGKILAISSFIYGKINYYA